MMSELSQNSSVPSCPALVGQPNPQNTAVFRITVPPLSHGCPSVSCVPHVPPLSPLYREGERGQGDRDAGVGDRVVDQLDRN